MIHWQRAETDAAVIYRYLDTGYVITVDKGTGTWDTRVRVELGDKPVDVSLAAFEELMRDIHRGNETRQP